MRSKLTKPSSSRSNGYFANSSKRSSYGVQAKLKANKPGDQYEVEADKTADHVVGQSMRSVLSGKSSAPGADFGKPLPVTLRPNVSSSAQCKEVEEDGDVQAKENDNLIFSASVVKKDNQTKVETDKLIDEKQKALKRINHFRENPNRRKIPFTNKTYEVTPKYENVSASQLAEELIERVNNPGCHKQKSLNLCGPAAYSVVWSNYDPIDYVEAVIDLYQTGSFIYNDLKIEANPNTFSQEVSNGLASVDWMLFSAIRHSENAVYDYDPEEDSGVSAFTTHWEMSSWLENIDNVTETRYSSPSIELINTKFKKGNTIVLLVDWNQLDDMKKKGKGGSKKSKKPDSYINSVLGNHYIIVKSKIIIEADKAVFMLWTWGKEEKVSIEKNKFNYAVKDSFIVEQTN